MPIDLQPKVLGYPAIVIILNQVENSTLKKGGHGNAPLGLPPPPPEERGGNSHCCLRELPEDFKKKKGSSEPFFKIWYPPTK